jgi:hypothetical protein
MATSILFVDGELYLAWTSVVVGAIVVALITLSTVLLRVPQKKVGQESILDCSLTLVRGVDYRFSAGAGKLAE